MLKRFGVIGLLLSASAVVLPTAAFAQEREQRSAYYGERQDNQREDREYRQDSRRGDYDDEERDRDNRDWRERGRVQTYYGGYYSPAPNYYAPAPNYYYGASPNYYYARPYSNR